MLYQQGKNRRDWLYVDDHCEAIRLVLEKGVPGETYNIGGESERGNLEVVPVESAGGTLTGAQRTFRERWLGPK